MRQTKAIGLPYTVGTAVHSVAEAPKILMFDLECSPSRGYFYDYKKEYNIIEIDQHTYMLSIAWKWKGEETIHCKALPDFPLYKRDKHDDYELVKFLHGLISQAAFVIGHNGDSFDIKYANTRFLKHRLGPPEPYKTRDTLKLSRKFSHQPTHRLDALAKFHGIGQKLPHTGKHLWFACMSSKYDAAAWRLMKRYNKHDVYLLDKIHDLYAPWDTGPSDNLIHRTAAVCPKIGCGSTRRWRQGRRYVKGGFKYQYQCLNCMGWYTENEIQKLPKLTFS